MNEIERRLAAVLAADVAGYSRLMNTDEEATVELWRKLRSEIINPLVRGHRGRIVKHTGDGFLVELPTATDAVRCAVALQLSLAEANSKISDERRMNFRMGINFGEISVDDDDIHGDGVNIAARLESLASVPGVCVTAQVYEATHKKVDCAFEDIGEHNVKNISESIHVYRVLCAIPAEREAAQSTPALAVEKPHKPSIAVLPFDNMSSEPDQEFFADGLTEDILTHLSRFKDLFVISRNSTFTYKGKAAKVKDVAQELGVRYVVEGSVRKSGDRVRVTAQLIDALSDRHVWAERYDRDLEDIFAIQDEITGAIAATLPGRVEADSQERTGLRPTDSMPAYEHVLAGKVLHHQSNREDNVRALKLLERAIDMDPKYAHARAWRACVLGQAWGYGWCDDPEETLAEVTAELERAQAIDDHDADIHRILAAVCITRNNFDQAGYHQQKALDLNPNYDLVVVQQGELLTWLGQAEEGVAWIKRAMALNPYHPPRFWGHLGRAHFVARQYEDAISALRHLDQLDVNQLAFLVAAYAHMGDAPLAQKSAQALKALDAEFHVDAHLAKLHFARPADQMHLREGLALAGVA